MSNQNQEPVSESRRRLIEKLKRELGFEIIHALNDPEVVEVMLNSDGVIWEDRIGVGMRTIGNMYSSDAESLLTTIASITGKEIHDQSPILECHLPLHGERFEGLVPPAVENASFAIRKRAGKIFTLGDYVNQGIMTEAQADDIRDAVKNRDNILVVGGTGSGKSTLVNGILDYLGRHASGDQRIVIIEDVPELQCAAPNKVNLLGSQAAGLNTLLRATMRLRPDRIVVGEVRDAAALTMLKAWNTGHPGGVCTVHANSPEAALIRLDQLCTEAGVPSQDTLIQEAVDVVIFIRKNETGKRLVERIWRPKVRV